MDKKKRQKYYGTKTMVPKRWSVDEENFILEHKSEMSMRELANALHRTLKSVEHKKRRLKEGRRYDNNKPLYDSAE